MPLYGNTRRWRRALRARRFNDTQACRNLKISQTPANSKSNFSQIQSKAKFQSKVGDRALGAVLMLASSPTRKSHCAGLRHDGGRKLRASSDGAAGAELQPGSRAGQHHGPPSRAGPQHLRAWRRRRRRPRKPTRARLWRVHVALTTSKQRLRCVRHQCALLKLFKLRLQHPPELTCNY